MISGYPISISFPLVDGWSTDPRVLGCHIIKGAGNGEKIFCDKIDNIPGKQGCKEYKKIKFGKQLGMSRKKIYKI